jgi:hypothetical protein
MKLASCGYALLVGIFGVIVACSSSSNGGGGAGGDGGACGTLSSSNAACNACMNSTCCSQGAACSNNPACLAIVDCYQNCSTDACLQGCTDNNPNGVNDFNTYTQCILNDCSVACIDTTGMDGGMPTTCGGFKWKAAACQTCFESACCSEGSKCAANPACAALDACNRNCTTQACLDMCSQTNPMGVDDHFAYDTCMLGPCGSACMLDGPDSGDQCGGFFVPDMCTENCLLTSCCSQALACSIDGECVGIFDCVGQCALGDSTCINKCGAAHTAAIPKFNAWQDCMNACPCGSTDAGAGGG